MSNPHPPGEPTNPQQNGPWPPQAPPPFSPPQYPYVPDQSQPPTTRLPTPQAPPQYPAQQFPTPQAPQYPTQQPQYPTQPPPPPGAPPGATPYTPGPQPAKKKSRVVTKTFSVLGVLLAVVAVVVVKTAGRDLLDKVFDGSGGDSNPPATVSAPAGPFEGTPATAYPESEAGIMLPAATAVPGFTSAQVTAGLENVKKAMIAARLDTKMLLSHDTSTFVNLLSPENREAVKTSFTKPDFFAYATHIAPGYSLRDEKIRVKGTVTFTGGTEQGIRLLKVETNFVWVYPFAGELVKPGDHLVVVHDKITWAFLADADVEPNFRGMYLDSWEGYASNIDCDLLNKSLIALGKPRFVPGATPGDDNAAFDPSHTLDIRSTC